MVGHHLLVSHGRAVDVLRDVNSDCKVGIALNLAPVHAVGAQDQENARQFDGELNRWFLDPIFGRGYPVDVVDYHTRQGRLPDGLSFVRADDLSVIGRPIDFLGVNYYSRSLFDGDAGDDPIPADALRTDMGWEVYPAGLYEVLERLHRQWSPPAIFVTENGAAYGTTPDEHGRVRDRAQGDRQGVRHRVRRQRREIAPRGRAPCGLSRDGVCAAHVLLCDRIARAGTR